MKTSLIVAALAWSWAVEASGRAAEKDGNNVADPEKRARSRSPRRTGAAPVAEPKGPAPKANGKAKQKYAPQNMNAIMGQQSAEEKERSKPSISTIHSKAAPTATLLSGAQRDSNTTESKATGSKATELKMAFECGPGGSLQVHGLWLTDKKMETEKSARDKTGAMWDKFYTAANTKSGSTEEARTLKSYSPWLWKGTQTPDDPLPLLEHEWFTHGQYVVFYVEKFMREGSGFVTRYLDLMSDFRLKAYNSLGRDMERQERECQRKHVTGRRFYRIHVCGTMEGEAVWC